MKTPDNTVRWTQGCPVEDIQAANAGDEVARDAVEVIRELSPRQNSTTYLECARCATEFQVSYTGIVRAVNGYACPRKPELKPITQDWVLNISQFKPATR